MAIDEIEAFRLAADWTVGACQSQSGCQVHIDVAHHGEVVSSSVNPK